MCGCGPSDCQYCAGEGLRRAATPQPGFEVETVQEARDEISRKLGGKGEGDFSVAQNIRLQLLKRSHKERKGARISTSIVHLLVGVFFVVELVLDFFLQLLAINIGVIKLSFDLVTTIEGIIEVEWPVVSEFLHAAPARVEIIVKVVVIHHLWWWLFNSWSSKYCKGIYWCRWMSRHGDWVGRESIWTGGGGLRSMGWVGGSVTRWRGLKLCSEVSWGIRVLIGYYVARIGLSAQVRHGCSMPRVAGVDVYAQIEGSSISFYG